MRIALWLGGNKGHPYKQVSKKLKAILSTIPGVLLAEFSTQKLLAGNIIKFFDCIVTYTQGGDFLPGEEDLLLDFIASGKGFVGIHGATASFKASPRYHACVGGTFTRHDMSRKFDVHPVDTAHFITNSIAPFKIKDEPYENDLDAGGVHVLAERRDKKGSAPAAWVKEHGKGRIAYIALGHFAGKFKLKPFQEMIRRSVLWTTRQSP